MRNANDMDNNFFTNYFFTDHIWLHSTKQLEPIFCVFLPIQFEQAFYLTKMIHLNPGIITQF